MTNLVTGIVGIAGVSIFLGIMVWWVQALPLIIIVVFVLTLLVIDFVQSLSSGNSNSNSNGAKS